MDERTIHRDRITGWKIFRGLVAFNARGGDASGACRFVSDGSPFDCCIGTITAGMFPISSRVDPDMDDANHIIRSAMKKTDLIPA